MLWGKDSFTMSRCRSSSSHSPHQQRLKTHWCQKEKPSCPPPCTHFLQKQISAKALTLGVILFSWDVTKKKKKKKNNNALNLKFKYIFRGEKVNIPKRYWLLNVENLSPPKCSILHPFPIIHGDDRPLSVIIPLMDTCKFSTNKQTNKQNFTILSGCSSFPVFTALWCCWKMLRFV